MKISNFHQYIFTACLTLLVVSSTSHAEIFKWVDANGQTHYSENKDDAGKGKSEALKIQSQPATNRATQDWQERERQFKQRQAVKENEKTYGASEAPRPKSLSGGVSDETDASKCNLGRDIISGAVRRPNMKPLEKHDREVAENDIRVFCH